MKSIILYSIASVMIISTSCKRETTTSSASSHIDADSPEEKINIIESSRDEIQWLSIEEAEKLMDVTPKKLFVDVYTDWCGFCKKMDRSTFTEEEIIAYVNQHFYAVRLNAEGTDTLRFNNQTYHNDDRFHQLATNWLSGRMGFPSFAYIDTDKQLITTIPGYRNDEELIVDLHFIHEEQYKTTDYDAFDQEYWERQD